MFLRWFSDCGYWVPLQVCSFVGPGLVCLVFVSVGEVFMLFRAGLVVRLFFLICCVYGPYYVAGFVVMCGLFQRLLVWFSRCWGCLVLVVMW